MITLEYDNEVGLLYEISQLEAGERIRVLGVPEDIYHKSPGYGSTKIKQVLDCPARALNELQQTPAMQLGSIVHCLVLEPQLLEQRYAVRPAVDGRTKEGKQAIKEFNENLEEGVEVIEQPVLDQANSVADAVLNSFGHFFKNKQAEVSYWYVEPTRGIILKARCDSEIQGELGIDLKTTCNAQPDQFARAIHRFGYGIQQALYMQVAQLDQFCFIAVETKTPYLSSGPYSIDGEYLNYCELKIEEAINMIAECQKTDNWPGYNKNKLIQVKLPNYLRITEDE